MGEGGGGRGEGHIPWGRGHCHTHPPHLRRLPKVVTRDSSIFCEVVLMACWIRDESGSLGMGLLWKQRWGRQCVLH